MQHIDDGVVNVLTGKTGFVSDRLVIRYSVRKTVLYRFPIFLLGSTAKRL